MKNYIIKQAGDKWQLWSKNGKTLLGEHDTEEAAKRQEAAIQARKRAMEAFNLTLTDEQLVNLYETLQTIKDVDIFAIGTWRGVNSPPEGDKYEKPDLEAMVEAFNAGIMTPKIKITHGSDKEQVDIGEVSNLRVQGNKLIGDYVNVPKALYELMRKHGLFKHRSAEVIWNLKDKAGKVWKRVIKAVALLAPGQKPAVGALSEGYQFEAMYCYELDYAGNISSIVGKWGAWAGSFRRCVSQLSGKPGISDPKALCAWMEHRATGKWPAEHQAPEDYEPSYEEVQSVELIAGGILSYIEQINHDKEAKKMADIQALMKKYGAKDEDELERILDAKLKEGDEAKEQIKTFEEKQKEQRLESVKQFIEKAKKEGKILPKEEETVTKQFQVLTEMGDDEGISRLKAFIDGLSSRVDLGEHSKKGDDGKEHDTEKKPADEVDRLVNEYINEGKAKDYEAALEMVKANHKELWESYLAK